VEFAAEELSGDRARGLRQGAQLDAGEGNPQALKRLVANGAQLRPLPQPLTEAFYKATKDTYADTAQKPRLQEGARQHGRVPRGRVSVVEIGFDAFMVRMRANG
jgi:hypothetical protein